MKEYSEKPLVVIICITYNHEHYIRNALEGFIMQQTSFPFVVIVHDDASSDNTPLIIQEYAEKYPEIIKPIYETENQYSKLDGSLIRIINEACFKTGAKYIATCEGDDYWIDMYKLQKQVDILESNPDCGVVYTNFMKKYANGKEEIADVKPLNGYQYESMLREELNIWTLTVCFRAELLKKVPELSPSEYFTGDILWFLTFTSTANVYYLPCITSVYRVLLESASHFLDRTKKAHFMTLSKKTINYMLENGPKVSSLTSRMVKRKLAKALIYEAYLCNNPKLLKQVSFFQFPIASERDIIFLFLMLGKIGFVYKLLQKLFLKFIQ